MSVGDNENSPVPRNHLSAALFVENALLCGHARRHFVKDFLGPLSIKTVADGRLAWKVGGRELVVDRNSFLVLHAGEPYSLEIESAKPVSTSVVFFQDGFVESVHGSRTSWDLDSRDKPVPLLPRLHQRDRRILALMHSLAAGGSRLRLTEVYLELASNLLLLDSAFNRRLRLLPGCRAATREELFRRVCRGQEFLHAHACTDVDLADVARAACLSAFHFHRAFTRAFGQTPHQYRNELRLSRARELLETTAMTVTEISGACGFRSAPSFSALFHRAFGVPPATIRRKSKF